MAALEVQVLVPRFLVKSRLFTGIRPTAHLLGDIHGLKGLSAGDKGRWEAQAFATSSASDEDFELPGSIQGNLNCWLVRASS